MADNNKTIGIVMTSFLIILLGVVFLSQTADQVNAATNRQFINSESVPISFNSTGVPNDTLRYSVANPPTGWRASGACPLANVVIANSSGHALTITTDYILSTSYGNFTIVNNADNNDSGAHGLDSSNATFVSYSYCGSSYQTGFSATILQLVPGFFALAILCAIAFIIFWVLRNEGVQIDI